MIKNHDKIVNRDTPSRGGTHKKLDHNKKLERHEQDWAPPSIVDV